ncbi:MAG: heavy-metal-associated domain-containing protein [Kaiparowitsia implicata GSE-PSE-MK54-09C]|jgi:copper chaperone|nr:heavy-metal-associated domain-containing protein [Kaiparowitsia implicata GSE-PSE-MK54-09C]
MTTLQMTVADMACSACVDTITRAVQGLDPAASVQADPQTKQVQVDSTADEAAIKAAIAAAGYSVA